MNTQTPIGCVSVSCSPITNAADAVVNISKQIKRKPSAVNNLSTKLVLDFGNSYNRGMVSLLAGFGNLVLGLWPTLLLTYMKVRTLIKKLYEAIRLGKKELEKKIYQKITRKSLKHKHTETVR